MKYIAGSTIQGKRKTKSYKVHKVEQVSKEDWIVVQDTHTPIIDRQTFEKAKILNKTDIKASQKTGNLSIWAGLLKCNDCKMAMNKKSSTNNSGKKYEYYICSTYRKKSNKLCTKHSIKVEDLEKAVLKAINLHISLLINIDEIIKQINNVGITTSRPQIIQNIINAKQKEILKKENLKISLYEDWKNEDITRKEYIEYKKKYESDIENLKQNIVSLQEEEKKSKKQNLDKNEWVEKFKKEKQINELSRDILLELIDCIYIHENGDITIKFDFQKPKCC